MTPVISYQNSGEALRGYEELIRNLIDSRGLKRICDIGGGAHPMLSAEFISKREIDFAVLDISARELNKAHHPFPKIVQDIAAGDFTLSERFDLVYSKMLAEHVKSGRRLHENLFAILNPGGLSVHFFPTLFAPPFVVNRIIPENLAFATLNAVAHRSRTPRVKFPSYYRWCRGPSMGMIRKFEEIGYEVVEYRGLFGHEGYYMKLPLLRAMHRGLTALLLTHPISFLTSFSIVILRKPASCR